VKTCDNPAGTTMNVRAMSYAEELLSCK